MRVPVILLTVALAGFFAGAALIGWWAVGAALMVTSAATAWFALFHDWPDIKPAVHVVPGARLTVADVLERARGAA